MRRKNRKPIKKKIDGSWRLGKMQFFYLCPECGNDVGHAEEEDILATVSFAVDAVQRWIGVI